VTKTYGRRLVLDDVDYVFQTGSFHLLVGHNGSGKTTLLRLLSTIAAPTSGAIHWGHEDGRPIADPVEVRKALGYAGHVPLVYDELTVRENLTFQLETRGHAPVDAAALARTWLKALDLDERRDERADTLSRGLRQRLALAQAFAHQPPFLLLDEPASNLDAHGLDALVRLLAQRRGNATIVVATHDPDPFRRLADHVIEVRAGKIQAWGATP
jgi:ABC-type multidrug transport system ATPase subunit